jgi:hypothetical protein
MTPETEKRCNEAFNLFVSGQSREIDPDSPMYEVMKITFRAGISEGGKLAAKMIAAGINEDVSRLMIEDVNPYANPHSGIGAFKKDSQ